MAFQSYQQLSDFLVTLGVTRAVFKPLSENDNSKQQIYLGGSFEALNQLPFGEIRIENEAARKNFKAAIDLWWVSDSAETEPARHAQLILYPKYPEVRLSGFLRGCSIAPSEQLRPIRVDRRTKMDGRFLVFGITDSNRVYVFLASKTSLVAKSIVADALDQQEIKGVFYTLPLKGVIDTKAFVLARLRAILDAGWHMSCRLDTFGKITPYQAMNGGGYTLEALLGIIPNGRSEPDFMGWEIKGFSKDRITLMTPEPDGGYYGEQGVRAFVGKYGHDTGRNIVYFTGVHKAGIRNPATQMILQLDGFDVATQKITNISGGIILVSDSGDIGASWSFSRLLEHWGRKHARAAYIRYNKRRVGTTCPEYHYLSPVWLGEGADFTVFLKAMSEGMVVYDPASKVTNSSSTRSTVKARSQFRIGFGKMHSLYDTFVAHHI